MYFKYIIIIIFIVTSCTKPESEKNHSNLSNKTQTSGNPIFEGWYADPEGVVFENEYWIFPTASDAFEKQVYLDAFSSKDLINWQKHERIIDTTMITWAREAIWAPSIIRKDGKYFLFFAANDVQSPVSPWWNPEVHVEGEIGGIGIAVASAPDGPYTDYLNKPLINEFYNNAQPIDQFVFMDVDSAYYIFYGGWGHCNLGKLNDDFTGFVPWEDGKLFHDITPENYVEGPFMFLRNEKYYLMWSEGQWGDSTYKVAYAIADNVTGPFERIGTILQSEKDLATGAGHNSAINVPGTDDWYIVYHRRPIPNKGRDHRVTCIDILDFNENGTIRDVKMTRTGVPEKLISGN
jgi:beta-xylosidase